MLNTSAGPSSGPQLWYALLWLFLFAQAQNALASEETQIFVPVGEIVTPIPVGQAVEDEEPPPPIGEIPETPNYIVLLTDDQRWDTTDYMPILKKKLIDRGVEFTNAFATNPECCPFRASMLAGGYHSSNTGVLRNEKLNGNIRNFNNDDTLATRLRGAGYKTGFVGRYMHGYEPNMMPVGWHSVASNSYLNIRDWFTLTDVTFGTRDDEGVVDKTWRDVDQYVTNFQRDEAIKFIENYGEDPFFLWVGFYAPHAPFIPDTQDDGTFDDYVFEEPEGFDEPDLSDKPQWVQRAAELWDESPGIRWHCTSKTARKSLETLQSVDRAVGAIVDAVEAQGLLDKTVFIFTSDNGMTYGEHRQPCDKGMAYEESIKVPFIVRMPGIAPRKESKMVAANLDIGATIYEHLGIPNNGDGANLMPLLEDSAAPWRTQVFLENFGYLEWRLEDYPVWAGLRIQEQGTMWKYVEHSSGEIELYNLDQDPKELESLHLEAQHAGLISTLSNKVAQQKGIAIITDKAPSGELNQSYTFTPQAWGGSPPYSWKVIDGSVPPGLTLLPGGQVIGTPNTAGTYSVTLEVNGQRTLPHKPQKEYFRRIYEIEIAP
ncbi:MAG: sulfatase-like hydrolase/transferase [Pseudomonadota bacterium]